MSNAHMRIESLGEVDLALGNELLELGYLAHFLKGEDFILLVSVNREAG
jgi:hypothetical protein